MDTLQIKKILRQDDKKSILAKITRLPSAEKGLAFELLLCELFKGNGWHVRHNGKKNDLGADILIYRSFAQKSPSFIVQAKNIRRPLTFDQVKIELLKFEDLSSKKYNCNNYLLYSSSNYCSSSLPLEKFNISLNGEADIYSLIESYSEKNYGKNAHILLAPHNKKTYRKIKVESKKNRVFAVVQATGTGKSYLISSQLNDLNSSKKALFIAPTNIILEKQKKKVEWLNNVEYKTYQQVMEDAQSERLKGDYSLIILDELHRAGASEWQKYIKQLFSINKQSIITGYSATPIRYLDDGRNMCHELFLSNVVHGPDLVEAIARGILNQPEYISAIYETEDNLVNKFKNNSEMLKSAISSWCGHQAIENILEKHPISNGEKYIVFCENRDSLELLKVQMEYAIKCLSIKNKKPVDICSLEVGYKYGHKKNNETIDKFESKENNLKLLFCVNILNEGLHVNDINGVFLFRKTLSPNIYMQQIGRCISVDSEVKTTVFDFVQNSENLSNFSINEKINEIRENIEIERKLMGIDTSIHLNSILAVNYTRNFFEVIEKIKDNNQPWKIKYNQLKDYYLKVGNTDIPQRSSPLGKFVSRLRDDYKRGSLSNERILLLKEIDFNFSPIDDKWYRAFNHCLSFSHENGMLPINAKDSESKKFYDSMRRLNRNNKISLEKRYLLNKHGFIWQTNNYLWSENFLKISILKNNGANLSEFPKKNNSIGKWMYKHKDKINKLNFKF